MPRDRCEKAASYTETSSRIYVINYIIRTMSYAVPNMCFVVVTPLNGALLRIDSRAGINYFAYGAQARSCHWVSTKLRQHYII